MSNNDYWLFRWLDDQSIETWNDLNRVLSYPIVINDLREQAINGDKNKSERKHPDRTSIVAGRGIDLSGYLDCSAKSCRMCQIENLFSHVWHYFDRIIVEDVVTHQLIAHWDDWESWNKEDLEHRKGWLVQNIDTLLCLKQLGAESLVEFRAKPAPCEIHWQKHAKDVGLQRVLQTAKKMVPSLAKEAEIEIHTEADGSHYFSFVHPLFEHTVWDTLHIRKIRGKSQDEINRTVATNVVACYMAHLTSDVSAAKKFKSPLGSTIRFHTKVLHPFDGLTTSNVAFKMELPVLQGISAGTLIKIRQDEHEYFKRFQDALRLAINERVKSAQSIDAAEVANEIRQDTIEPALRRIRDRLMASEKVLTKKTAVGVFLTILTTTCGILAGVPPALTVTGGLAPMITMTGQAASKYLEEKRDIELEDMYFLWKAIEHQHQED
jgi:hypothetical protein